jgi:hypothetical protein
VSYTLKMTVKIPSKRKRNIYSRRGVSASENVTLTVHVSVGYAFFGISWFNSSAGVARTTEATGMRRK